MYIHCVFNVVSLKCFKVGADGAKSLLRKTANIQTMAWEYGQMGVVATVELSEVRNITV